MEVLLDHFPRDIANIIDEMKNHSEHYEQLKHCFVPLQIKVLLRQLDQNDLKMYHNQHELDQIYRKICPDLQSSLELLAQCKCCDIHQECKPTTMHNLKESDYRVQSEILKNEPRRETTCFCQCRHYARILTRSHLYSVVEHEEDNRYVLHEVFLRTHEELKQALSVLCELRKQKKKWLQLINTVYKDDNYTTKYKEYSCNYYEVISKIENQESIVYTCEEKDVEIIHMLENHILDFPSIVTTYDAMFTEMFIYPGYDIMYDTDMSYNSEDNEMNDI